MNITKVTFTGADRYTDINKMMAISDEYPFVEWGILISQKHSGFQVRYPPLDWVHLLLSANGKADNKMALAGHFCGMFCRMMLDGDFSPLDFAFGLNQPMPRIQLNFHDEYVSFDRDKFIYGVGRSFTGREIIFQIDGHNIKIYNEVKKFHWAVPLYDLSGGTGVVPDMWPDVQPGKVCGYAGGLGPDNLNHELKRIESVVGGNDIWIDMETKVRTNEIFDLKKVEECLSVLGRWIKRQP